MREKKILMLGILDDLINGKAPNALHYQEYFGIDRDMFIELLIELQTYGLISGAIFDLEKEKSLVPLLDQVQVTEHGQTWFNQKVIQLQ